MALIRQPTHRQKAPQRPIEVHNRLCPQSDPGGGHGGNPHPAGTIDSGPQTLKGPQLVAATREQLRGPNHGAPRREGWTGQGQ